LPDLSRRDIRDAAHESDQHDRITKHAVPMQPAYTVHRIGIAGTSGNKLFIHLFQELAARPHRESRHQANSKSENQSTCHGKGHVPDDASNTHHQKIRH
jgi:hypothetical protein